MRILVADAHRGVAETYVAALTQLGYTADAALSADTVREALRGAFFDVVFLEPDQPGGDDLLREIREISPNTAVVIITRRPFTPEFARQMIQERVADFIPSDVLQKPIGLAELREVVDRHGRTIEHGSLLVDIHTNEAWYGDNRLDLTPTEIQILSVLMRLPDKPQTYSELAWHIYREKMDDRSANDRLSSHMMRLREKVEAAAGRELILSPAVEYPKRGYILAAKV